MMQNMRSATQEQVYVSVQPLGSTTPEPWSPTAGLTFSHFGEKLYVLTPFPYQICDLADKASVTVTLKLSI